MEKSSKLSEADRELLHDLQRMDRNYLTLELFKALKRVRAAEMMVMEFSSAAIDQGQAIRTGNVNRASDLAAKLEDLAEFAVDQLVSLDGLGIVYPESEE